MKRRITLSLDAALLQEIEKLATEEANSIEDWLVRLLEQMVCERRAYDRARTRALARLRKGLDLRWTRSGTRNELHER